MIAEDKLDVIVSHGGAVVGDHSETARHAQMDNHGTSLQVQEQVFRPALHGPDGLAFQVLGQIRRHRPAQAGVADNYPLDGLALAVRRNALTGGFNFR